ncbi:hypothetical protein [Massilia genomosp. 1]|uniref:Uncharacterized protein n=1 Tax=Massilia genomosp. 1 TaxID=2609280 RepID=A0ABX0MTG2_9BURK|nr:hypothetical protein [Massilia genomosp. 1]NHZ66030.1 hypothetical protein [Massilia genomosp. 1]
MHEISLFQAITLAVAFVGAVLGIINTWAGLDKSRVKLIVSTAHLVPVGNADPRLRFSITITNLSAFPVTLIDAGVFYHGTSERGSFVMPIFSDGGNWPKKLEPRTSVAIYAERPRPNGVHRIKTAYARTACGVTKTGGGKALKQIAAEET